ncbi:hypothetical protein ACAG26_21060 [Mycobacterium sp. pUA109]|uniref:hypothetical protein n=1 Tax=Mycobacterium sp. pUA109 TaxID=3238982 RepID=UPI00351B3CF4
MREEGGVAAVWLALLLIALGWAPVAGAAPNQPPCESVDLSYGKTLAEQHVRCVLGVNAHLSLDVTSDPAWSFVVRRDGAPGQTFREPTDAIGETGVVPLLQDIDDDGIPELLVVTGRGGTGGEPMAVWRLADQTQQFVRAGDLFGKRLFYRTPEGFFGNYAHASAMSGGVALYRWANNTLTEVAVLDMAVAGNRPPEDPPGHDWVKNGNTLCALAGGDYAASLRAAGIDPATAQQRFCAQPWVATVYRS